MNDLEKLVKEVEAVERRERIDAANKFFVSAIADRVTILKPPLGHIGMSADEALNLAAWLVAIAEYRATSTFAEVLAKVQGS